MKDAIDAGGISAKIFWSLFAVDVENRPIDANSPGNRADCGSLKFPFEIKSANF
jgi:hypothetical protein